jgi:small subunit ribosomal protein S8
MDIISDMLTRIRNGGMRGKRSVIVIRSNYCLRILDCLVTAGYLNGYSVNERNVEVFLKYVGNEPLLKDIKRVSRPGFRRYSSYKNFMYKFTGDEVVVYSSTDGISIYSSKGCFGVAAPSMKQIGGEILFIIK